MIKKILIAIDDSPYAEHAAEYGFNLAASLNAEVGLVHMVEAASIPLANSGADEILGIPMQGITVGNELDLMNVQDEISKNILERSAKKYGGNLRVTQFNEFGDTGEGIIKCSQAFKADLLITGTHHHSGLDRLLSDNIAEYVVRHSDIPVLVVPSKK